MTASPTLQSAALAAARLDLHAFVRPVFSTLNPGASLKSGWYLQAIAHALAKVGRGETTRLLITLPPRYLKSICGSVAIPAWALGNDQTLRFLVASYSAELSNKLTRDFRAVVESRWYRQCFPEFQIKRATEVEVETSRRGFRRSVSLGGSVTGMGGDILIIDDLMKAADGIVSANAPCTPCRGRKPGMARRPKPDNPFRWFDSSPEVIQMVVMLYVRFPLSLRNVEDLAFERGVDICHETVRLWVNRFGPMFAAKIRSRRVQAMRQHTHWRWHLDEVFVRVNGERRYLWRAVDHEGEVLESFVTKTRDKVAALKFLKKALKRHGRVRAIVTDRLRSYRAAMRQLGNQGKQEVGRWANNRAENSHLPFRRRERAMQRFRRMKTLQRFVSTHAAFHNHFSQERHLVSRHEYRTRRSAALAEWKSLVA